MEEVRFVVRPRLERKLLEDLVALHSKVGKDTDTKISRAADLVLLVVGVVHTGLAYLMYFGSIEQLRAQSVAIQSYIDPVSALLFSAAFLGEALTVPAQIGAVMIIGSAIISEKAGSKPELR